MNEFGGVLFEAAQPSDRVAAFGLALAISAIFAFATPFAAVQLVHVSAFIPLYDCAVVINDFLTGAGFAALFSARGDRGLLFLAAGNLWTGLLAPAHLLSFPGVFAPTWLRAGPQTAAWLYMVWHIGFPTAVIFYAVAGTPVIQSRRRALAIAALAVAVVVAGLVLLSTGGHELLPAIIQRDDKKPLASLISGGICLVGAFAMGRVFGARHGTLTRLDLSLAVVMYAWIGDVVLSGVLNAGRYSLGWYAGRFFGFLAASFVMYQMVLLAVVEHWRRIRL